MRDHLTHSISELRLPIYIKLAGADCRPPADLALGDSLMVLGLLRNYGKPVRLHMNPPPALLPLLERHPLIQDICPPDEDSGLKLRKLALPRSGRPATWQADIIHTMPIGRIPLDQVKANPILAHSLYYNLPRREDWPSLMLDSQARGLASLLARGKPSLVLFPRNPGRSDANWQDEAWWLELIKKLRPAYHIIMAGGSQYGALSREADAALPMSAPESTLLNLAWLISQAHGYIGRDGGLSHLAAAVRANVVVVWDSMLSYRYWGSGRAHNIIMSNPELFRFPQRLALTMDNLPRLCPRISYSDGEGRTRVADMPGESQAYLEKALELFGGMDTLQRLALGNLEQEQERNGVSQWLQNPALKNQFYQQSLEFALKALQGRLRPGGNWLVPFSAAFGTADFK